MVWFFTNMRWDDNIIYKWKNTLHTTTTKIQQTQAKISAIFRISYEHYLYCFIYMYCKYIYKHKL